jgi:rhamnosyltransferase
MDRNRIAAVVVTFNPDGDIIDNLELMASAVNCLIVVDNTPDENRLFFSSMNIVYLQENGNVGLSKALNDGVNYAGKLGFHNIFLLDQDSIATLQFFKNMLTFKNKIDLQISNCAFYVPNFYDRNSQSWARYPLLTSFSIQHKRCDSISPFYQNRALIAITSGTLMTYDRFMQIGPFREDYFIDFIDNEYCLRAAKKHLSVAVNCKATINHSIGKRQRKQILWFEIKPNNHTAVRRYYIARNGIRTAMIYFSEFKLYLLLILLRLGHEILSILLSEKSKTIKLKALLVGLADGFIGKMGPCTHHEFDLHSPE